jgi:hypothetical protein
LFPLAGCPVPAYYYFTDSNHEKIIISNCEVNIRSIHPWRNTNKKTISIFATITNTNASGRIIFSLPQDLALRSQADSFFLHSTNTYQVDKLLMKGDTVIVEPGIKREVALYFISKKEYTAHQYQRSIERDTLVLTMGVQETHLAGKNNRSLLGY